jgi:aldehyde:ferredoxin oxidoreductase
LDKFLRIDVSEKKFAYEKIKEKYTYLSGRSLIAEFMLDEVKPTCEPLGRNNKMIISSGLLSGAGVSSAGRISIGSKSPLTGGIKESNGGGITAGALAGLGIRAVILEGFPENDITYNLIIDENGCAFEDADKYKLMGTYEFCDLMLKKYPDSAIACIGPAGENRLRGAGIATIDKEGVPSRYCGRGGLGAVMGSKKIKGIIVCGKGDKYINNEVEFKKSLQEYNKILVTAPSTKAYREYGTVGGVDVINALGGLPVNNFSRGRYDKVNKINAEAMNKLIDERGGEGRKSHACMPGCVIGCSNVIPDKDGKAIVSPLEYETMGLMGCNLGIDSIDVIAKFNYLCNDIGVDTIETGVALGVALEAGIAEFGDVEAIKNLLEEIRQGTVLGRVLGNGARTTGEVLGVLNVPQAKGQAFASYDPRAIKGLGVTYATTAMGADHTCGPTHRAPLDHAKPDGQAELSRKMQKMIPIVDSTGLCLFTLGAIGAHQQVILDLINSRFGWNLNQEWLDKMCEDTLKKEHEFNRRAGFTDVHNRLPESFTERILPGLETSFDVSDEDLDSAVFS